MLVNFVKRIYNRFPAVSERRDIRSALWNIEKHLIHQQRKLDRLEAQLACQMIRLVDFDLDEHPRYGDPTRLLRYRSQICSQNSEDGMIHEIFRRIGTSNKIFAEIGVGNGRENNTAFLLSTGWSGYWLDASADFMNALENRQDLQGHLHYTVDFITRENVSSLFKELSVPIDFDLLSIDIDQNTYYAWEGLKDYKPRVVVVEYNSALPPDIAWKVIYQPTRTCDGTQNYGASLKSFELLGNQFGYSLVGCDFTGLNAFFVRNDLVEDKFSKPFTSENHYEPPRYPMLLRRSHKNQLLDRPPI
jgi:hypothetical protein